jgi:isopenicillin N synthase-like dioxygenase
MATHATLSQLRQVIDIAPFVLKDDWEHKPHHEITTMQSRIVAQVRQAVESIGFLLIANHGVPSTVVTAAKDAATAFFDQPDEIKRRCFINRAPVPRGYSASGKENFAILSLHNQRRPNDLVEKFRMGPPTKPDHPLSMVSKDENMMFYPNIWPDPDIPRLQWAMEQYYDSMASLARMLFRIFEACLDLPSGFFAAKTTQHTSILSANRYPPVADVKSVQKGQLRLAQHTDVDIFTIVCPDYNDSSECLEIQTKDGSWAPVPLVPDTFVVNLGDCFKFWTNEVWMSTSHRVIIPPHGFESSRLSIAYFVGANIDASLDCISSCCIGSTCQLCERPKTYVEWRKARIQQAMTQLKKTKRCSGFDDE